jgi:hypothetical protein
MCLSMKLYLLFIQLRSVDTIERFLLARLLEYSTKKLLQSIDQHDLQSRTLLVSRFH